MDLIWWICYILCKLFFVCKFFLILHSQYFVYIFGYCHFDYNIESIFTGIFLRLMDLNTWHPQLWEILLMLSPILISSSHLPSSSSRTLIILLLFLLNSLQSSQISSPFLFKSSLNFCCYLEFFSLFFFLLIIVP